MTDNTVKLNQTAQIIYDAIVDLHNLEQDATRDAIRDVTGLKMTMVDDHVKTLCEKEFIRRKLPGVFVPMEIPPPARPISMTEIPGGLVKIEIGDYLLELWPREQRILGKMMAGAATQYAAIQANYEAGNMAEQGAVAAKRWHKANAHRCTFFAEENGRTVGLASPFTQTP